MGLRLSERRLSASNEALAIYELEDSGESISLEHIQKMADISDRDKLDKALLDLINDNKSYNETFKIHTHNQKVKYLNSRASVFRDKNNNPIKVVGVIHDVTDVRVKEMELQYLNERYYLTELYNRRFYFDQFERLNQPEFYPLGIMMLDVNGLKIVNDAFGHDVGDRVLEMLGAMLKSTFEQKDIVSRIGGDEFTVLLPNTTAEKVQLYKTSLMDVVKSKKIKNIEMSLAIGYELITSQEQDVDDIQKLAENQMYRHKTTVGASVRSKAINAIFMTLTDKYETERTHSSKVSELCKKMGIALKLREDEIKELEQAGLFHDIGKISIPDSILDKPGKLTKEEFEVIKTHTEIGYQILRAADEYSDLAIHALHHHERWDGNGYPRGLKKEEIPLYSRIINIVDAFEAMTADRPYRKKLSRAYAVEEIIRCSGAQFDPRLARVFIEKILKAKWEEEK